MQAFQNIEDELGLDFGFPATSTRTSSDDFTTTTLIGFSDEGRYYTDGALGYDAGTAHAAGCTPRFEASDGGAASRATPLRQAICADQAGQDVGTAGPRALGTTHRAHSQSQPVIASDSQWGGCSPSEERASNQSHPIMFCVNEWHNVGDYMSYLKLT